MMIKALENIKIFLQGKKTSIAVILNFAVWGLYGTKVIDESTRNIMLGMIASLATYGFYDMVKRNLKGK